MLGKKGRDGTNLYGIRRKLSHHRVLLNIGEDFVICWYRRYLNDFFCFCFVLYVVGLWIAV